MSPHTDVDRAFASLVALARDDARLASEAERAREEFFEATTMAPQDELAERRFFEWFLLERVCDDSSAVPLERLNERIDASTAPELDAHLTTLLNSRAGAFEVSGVQAGVGVWLRDLAGRGEVPVGEADASRALAVGDLIVGRVFPLDDGSFELSRAAGCFRHPELVGAVERDLERARGATRGPLRIGQRELERMFFAAAPANAGANAGAAADPVGDARAALTAEGLDAQHVAAILAHLASRPYDPEVWALGTASDALGAVLDELAFDTDVDLERVRQTLLAAWPELASSTSTTRPPRVERPQPTPSPTTDVRTALDEFDDGRGAGRDLDGLFRELEQRLGLEPEPPEDTGELPDFPGVVGAMVVEFLWEQHARDPERAAGWQDLTLLGQATRGVGVFENLTTADLVRFAAFWVPETRPPVQGAELVEGLRAFARWCTEEHQIEGLRDADERLAPLVTSLPRVLDANAELPSDDGDASEAGELFVLKSKSGAVPILADAGGGEHETPLPDAVSEHLAPDDRLRVVAGRVVRVYPPQIAGAEPGR